MKIRNRGEAKKAQLDMTSMIDIVFLLLIFFVMTFKIVELEGDFDVRMPLPDATSIPDPTDLPLKLRLISDQFGNLDSMMLDDRSLGNGPESFDRLRAAVISIIGVSAPIEGDDGPSIEIDADYDLRYENTINAMTAVRGYKDGDQEVPLIQNINFAKPRD